MVSPRPAQKTPSPSLLEKDLIRGGTGRAAVVDWALKDHYSASDVQRWTDANLIAEQFGGLDSVNVPFTARSAAAEFAARTAEDDRLRRRKLDNRIEWLIMTGLVVGGITYNDGKITFTVDYGRPAAQTDEAPPGGLWTLTTSDPIGDILAMQEVMFDTYGVRMTRAIGSRKALAAMMNSELFVARSGFVPQTGVDLNYLMQGWGPQMAKQIVSNATGVTFTEYDSVYRTRPIGSTTITNNRFMAQEKVLFLPDPADVSDLSDGSLGFGKTLTSPHPEGNWGTGFYEWEEETKDPWGVNRGTGVKAFPVLPHLELTFTMSVIAP